MEEGQKLDETSTTGHFSPDWVIMLDHIQKRKLAIKNGVDWMHRVMHWQNTMVGWPKSETRKLQTARETKDGLFVQAVALYQYEQQRDSNRTKKLSLIKGLDGLDNGAGDDEDDNDDEDVMLAELAHAVLQIASDI
ncbi:hypothetical protein Hypma_016141 [Hypsizygus marmoreus]|uniref:Uncharacterized protein n=1 Tax=Hypsizygus marmoreus TaxID=39966 RepID=A0A369J2X7_HYPMA|nr:hypothetical protein Hypma_016141 [Hypsizygus marmoreus]